MVAKLDGTNGLLQQYDYQTPTTGFSYTFAAGTTVLVMNPAGTLATGTITMPAAPVDGMTISFSSTQQITALTVAGNTGQSIVGNPTTMLAGGAATFVYRLSNTTWYAQISTAAVGAPVSQPTITLFTSPGTWTKPVTVKTVKVTVLSGGGGGGGQKGGSFGAGGGGGGGGGVTYILASSIPGPQTVTAGTGGAAGTSPPGAAGQGVVAGSPGGTASFGTFITATGGAGSGITANSIPAPTYPTYIVGGAGGAVTPSPTTLVFPGTSGGSGSPATSGAGGTQAWQPWGIPPPAVGAVNTPGTSGTGYAQGGSGGWGSSPAGQPGGNGTAGFVLIEEFY
jgi:hypothetical protein